MRARTPPPITSRSTAKRKSTLRDQAGSWEHHVGTAAIDVSNTEPRLNNSAYQGWSGMEHRYVNETGVSTVLFSMTPPKPQYSEALAHCLARQSAAVSGNLFW